MSFDTIWQNIIHCAGQEFQTKRGIPFTYAVNGSSVVPTHTGYPLQKTEFEKAFQTSNLTGPGQINGTVRGPSYVYAILTDDRIRNG